jgi:hypothetical protein
MFNLCNPDKDRGGRKAATGPGRGLFAFLNGDFGPALVSAQASAVTGHPLKFYHVQYMISPPSKAPIAKQVSKQRLGCKAAVPHRTNIEAVIHLYSKNGPCFRGNALFEAAHSPTFIYPRA